jgi:polyferredoxin
MSEYWAYWFLAILMSYFMSWLIKRATISNSSTNKALVFYLLVTMATMLGGWIIYLLSPNAAGIVEAVGVNMVIMTVGVIVILRYWDKASVDQIAAPLANDVIATEGQQTASESSDAAELEHATALANAYVLYFVVMMASMTALGFVYIIMGGTLGLEVGLIVATAIMVSGTIPILRRSARSSSSLTKRVSSDLLKSYSVRGVIIALALFNELLMGWSFVLASGTPALPRTGSLVQNATSSFATVVGSGWFIFTMALEMALTIYMLRNEFQRSFVPIFALQAAVMVTAPTAINDATWHVASIYVGSIAMIGLMILLLEHMFKERLLNMATRAYFLILMSLLALMMAGLFEWVLYGNSLLFVFSILGEMVLYFNAVLSQKDFKRTSTSATKSWMTEPLWVFGMMLTMLITEFFMGGLIDAQYYGASFIRGISYAPLTGSVLVQSGAILYNFLAFFATITGSSWFLIMMGAEMGTLVVLKIRYARELETKIRLALVVVVYAIYSVFVPYFVLSMNQMPKIPLMGWSMGLGTAGAIAPDVIIAIAATYLISGILSFLFGSRQVCSLFCTAALMYQGTFPDSMKEFNRTSKLGKKLLTSRMSGLYKTVSSLVIASIIIATAVSYMDSIGLINITIFGSDVAYFLYLFYFDFLWYVLFISIPFVGTYACVSTGMCHWGLFNQFVSRFGLFKLKVKDPDMCARCPTKDCAKACPVGLTDLPSKFISSGEFKSHKCIGVGNCVSSCPYENEYIFDIRHKIGLTKIGKINPSVQLPVMKNTAVATDENMM